MAEYIEREKLSFHLASEIENCGEADSSHRPIAYGSMLGLKTALSYVNTLPSADVVEVVRCKDCKHWGRCVYDPIKEKMYGECSRTLENFDSKAETSEDVFCSYGQRKEREKV